MRRDNRFNRFYLYNRYKRTAAGLITSAQPYLPENLYVKSLSVTIIRVIQVARVVRTVSIVMKLTKSGVVAVVRHRARVNVRPLETNYELASEFDSRQFERVWRPERPLRALC